MCLTCAFGRMTKEQKKKLFICGHEKVVIHTYDNKEFSVTRLQMDEIIQHALYVVATSVDFSTDIWAIQWPRDYEVKTFKLVNKPVETTNEQPKIIITQKMKQFIWHDKKGGDFGRFTNDIKQATKFDSYKDAKQFMKNHFGKDIIVQYLFY